MQSPKHLERFWGIGVLEVEDGGYVIPADFDDLALLVECYRFVGELLELDGDLFVPCQVITGFVPVSRVMASRLKLICRWGYEGVRARAYASHLHPYAELIFAKLGQGMQERVVCGDWPSVNDFLKVLRDEAQTRIVRREAANRRRMVSDQIASHELQARRTIASANCTKVIRMRLTDFQSAGFQNQWANVHGLKKALPRFTATLRKMSPHCLGCVTRLCHRMGVGYYFDAVLGFGADEARSFAEIEEAIRACWFEACWSAGISHLLCGMDFVDPSQNLNAPPLSKGQFFAEVEALVLYYAELDLHLKLTGHAVGRTHLIWPQPKAPIRKRGGARSKPKCSKVTQPVSPASPVVWTQVPVFVASPFSSPSSAFKPLG